MFAYLLICESDIDPNVITIDSCSVLVIELFGVLSL